MLGKPGIDNLSCQRRCQGALVVDKGHFPILFSSTVELQDLRDRSLVAFFVFLRVFLDCHLPEYLELEPSILRRLHCSEHHLIKWLPF